MRFFGHDSAGVYGNSERKHKGAWLGPATVLAQEMGRSQEQHEEAHGTVWIVVQGRLLRCALEHLRHLSERESLSIDRDKGRQGESSNVHRHCSGFPFLERRTR